MANRPFCCLPSGKLYSTREKCGCGADLSVDLLGQREERLAFHEKVKVKRFSWSVKIN